MSDAVFDAFLREQFRQGMALAGQSDLISLAPMEQGAAPSFYVATFFCKGLIQKADGEIAAAQEFHVGLSFPPDYLRRVAPLQVLTWLDPPNVWHPNIRPPAICVGHIAPGTELCDLLYQVFEIVTYANWASHDALNPDAAQWARNHQELFPLDRRPLKRRAMRLTVTDEVQTT
jgi:hypothetical protein